MFILCDAIPFSLRKAWCSLNRRASVFSHLFARDETDPSLSLSLQLKTDVLLEQRDLFARIDQVCATFARSFCKQSAKERSESFVDATVRHSFPIGGGLDCLVSLS